MALRRLKGLSVLLPRTLSFSLGTVRTAAPSPGSSPGRSSGGGASACSVPRCGVEEEAAAAAAADDVDFSLFGLFLGLLDYGKNQNHDYFWSMLKSRLFKGLFFEFENMVHLFSVSFPKKTLCNRELKNNKKIH